MSFLKLMENLRKRLKESTEEKEKSLLKISSRIDTKKTWPRISQQNHEN